MLGQHWQFIKGYFSDPERVGALTPSSRALAAALCRPYECCREEDTSLLEVGAGTGAITKYLGGILKPSDTLDICEIQLEFADFLRHHVLSNGRLASGACEERVRLFCCPIQELPTGRTYDFIISGLPLTRFDFRDVRDVLSTFRRLLKPAGVLSYFEYIGVRRVARAIALGKHRRRYRLVSAYLTRNIRAHQFARDTVLQNLPPAHARHLRFGNGADFNNSYAQTPATV